MSLAVIGSIGQGQGIVVRKQLIEANGSEILANRLDGVAEGLGDTARITRRGQQFPSVCGRPERQQGLDARIRAGSGRIVGDKRKVAQSQVLPQTFVISKNEALVLAKRAA